MHESVTKYFNLPVLSKPLIPLTHTISFTVFLFSSYAGKVLKHPKFSYCVYAPKVDELLEEEEKKTLWKPS